MTRMEYLKKKREEAYHDLMCYSKNLSMTLPKEGREGEWSEKREECRIVEALIAEGRGAMERLDAGPLVIDGRVVDNWEAVLAAGRRLGDD